MKDTKNKPITEEEFMKDIGHGVENGELLKNRQGCAICPRTEDTLDMKTKLYNGFGGYTVYKDGVYLWSEDMNKDYEKCATPRKVENMVVLDNKAKWEIRLDLPLRSAIWERKEKNKWVLIKTGQGFA